MSAVYSTIVDFVFWRTYYVTVLHLHAFSEYYTLYFDMSYTLLSTFYGIARSECDGTRAETRFGLSAKRTSPFKSAGVSVQSTAGSRGVCISGQRVYYL